MINGIINASWEEKKIKRSRKRGVRESWRGCVSTALRVREVGGEEKGRGEERREAGGTEGGRWWSSLPVAHMPHGGLLEATARSAAPAAFIFRGWRCEGGKGGGEGRGEVRKDQEGRRTRRLPSAVRWQRGATAHQHSSGRCLPSLSEVRSAVA